MESQTTDEGDQFFDALDDFPFYDCLSFDQSATPASSSTSTLRRRPFSCHEKSSSFKEPGDSFQDSSTLVSNSKTTCREPRSKPYRDLKANELSSEITESTGDGLTSTSVIEEKNNVESTVTTTKNEDLVYRARDLADSGNELSESPQSSSSLLLFIASLVLKAIGFQLNLFISFITLPLSVLSCCYMFIVDPFQAFKHGRAYIITKLSNLWNSICGYISPALYEWFKDNQSIWNLVFRFGWGMMWAAYVGCVLCGLLFTSLLISGVLMKYLVEEPLVIKETLNFDYTKSSPVAFVPTVSCDTVRGGVKCMEKIDVGKNVGSRVIPPHHKLQVTISLTLPESDYNSNLGMFQVRVDFLSVNGGTLASSSHPCMLKFKSDAIRLLLTFIKAAPLVAGYVSEEQTLKLKIRGLNEGIVPTACLRVVLEQRAEYRPGAGIPELYDASLVLESELPFIKRIIWYWKRTIFIWVCMTSFIIEVLFTLVCCRPILIPRSRTRDGSANSTSTRRQAQI